MGFASRTFGFQSYNTGDSYSNAVTPEQEIVASLGVLKRGSFAVDGVEFIGDFSFEPYRREAFRYRSVPAQREAVTYNNEPGEGTVNTEGLWDRGQFDFSQGAGELFLDRGKRGLGAARFYRSKGLDPFTIEGQLTALPDVKHHYATSNAKVHVSRCGTSVYIMDSDAIYRMTSWLATPTICTFNTASGTYTTPTTIYAITSNDAYLYAATDTGVWYCAAGATVCNNFAIPDTASGFTGGFTLVRWCNDQVIAAYKNRLYGFSFGHTLGTAPLSTDILLTHANPNWVWSDACGGETQTYFTGYVSQGGANFAGVVYRSALDVTGSTSSAPWLLDSPVQALPLSVDEYPVCIESFLNYFFVGTNKGIRMCQTLSIYDPNATETGDLKAGPYIPNVLQPVSSPVVAIKGQGQFVYFSWSDYDGTSTGLGKLNLYEFIEGDPLTPGYCSDLMVTGSGVVTSIDYDPNLNCPMFAVAGLGVYTPDLASPGVVNNYVANFALETSIITYGIRQDKIPVYFDYGAMLPGGTVTAQLITDPLTPSMSETTLLDGIATSADDTIVACPLNVRDENFRVILTGTTGLNSSGNYVYSPVIYRWTLQAWPCIVQSYMISMVVRNFEAMQQRRYKVRNSPQATFLFFDNLYQNQSVVTFQEGSMSIQAVVNSMDNLPHSETDKRDHSLQGDLVVYMMTVGPWSLLPGAADIAA